MASIILKTDLGYSSAIEACGAIGATTVLFHEGPLEVGTLLFTNPLLEIGTQFDGQDLWWQLSDGTVVLNINTTGVVIEKEGCAPEPTPTATEVEPTPTETEIEPTPTETEVEPTPTETEVEPTPTETEVEPTPTPTPEPTATEIPPTATPTATATPEPTATPTPTPTPTPDNVPVATAAAYDIAWGGTLSITLVGTDDQDTGNLTYAITSNPTRGTVALVGNTATYTHDAASTIGSDSFEFTVTDTASQTSAPAIITINPENSVPVITTTSVSVLQNTTSTFIVNATDADGDKVSFIQITATPGKTPNGTISFVLNDDYTSITVTYTPGYM
jgi:hypothetical protein